jgi:uncharacterized protein
VRPEEDDARDPPEPPPRRRGRHGRARSPLGTQQPRLEPRHVARRARADLVDEPASLVWNDVHTPDVDAGNRFYTSVLGWSAGRPSFEAAPDIYTVWEMHGRGVGGMMNMTHEYPNEIPPHWRVRFAVADCDDAVAKARRPGANVMGEPVDMPIGRFTAIIEPHGASLTVMAPVASG